MITLLQILLASLFLLQTGNMDGTQILNKVDENISSDNRIFEATMIVHGRRGSRTITLKGWSEGYTRSLTEYLSPAREAGTKMLKLEDKLWIYTPFSDRTIQISGHMLRQSVMGSDMSYEDMMEDRKMTEMYTSTIAGKESIGDRNCWVLELEAKTEDVTYKSRKIWVDTERFIPLKEELFAKSGQLLKKTELSDAKLIDGRWYPMTILYKDMLKEGEGTKITMDDISFNQKIPEHYFSKAALK